MTASRIVRFITLALRGTMQVDRTPSLPFSLVFSQRSSLPVAGSMNLFKSLFGGADKKPVTTDLTKRFELLNQIGKGTMSKVWKAKDPQTGQMVVIKILDAEKTRQLEEKFKDVDKPSEGEIAVQLQHPNVVRTLEFGLTPEGEQFLVMELVDGKGLSIFIEQQNEAMRTNRPKWICDLGEAIIYVHGKNFIHRDLCPDNILISRQGKLKLIDFGLTIPNTAPFRKPGNRTGKAMYMAPELIKRQPTDQRVDVFAYSLVCYEMWAKDLPWARGESLDVVLRNINRPPKEISEAAPNIDSDTAQIIMKGLERRPDDRWPSVRKMVEELRKVA